jgi:phage terminase large subunit GpA-like protein
VSIQTVYPSAEKSIFSALAKSFSPRKHISVSEWADANRILSSKTSAEAGVWRTERNPPQREIMDCFSSRSGVQEVVLMLPIQFGKALALNTPIATPTGWSEMGEINIGDVVFDENGQPCHVTAVSETFTDHTCYKLTFSDGAEIIADAGHLWTVDNNRHYHNVKKETITTNEMEKNFKHGKNNIYAIPVAKALQIPDVNLPIKPYTLGAWLGDENSASAQITQHYLDAPHLISKIQKDGYDISIDDTKSAWILKLDHSGIRNGICLRGHNIFKTGIYKKNNADRCAECYRQGSKNSQYGFVMDEVINRTFFYKLKSENLIKNKHIPDRYLRSSFEQRLELLKGLMDTDGTINKKSGRCSISSSYPALANGIMELITSLGLKPTAYIKKTYRKDSCCISFTAYSDTPVFSLQRKLALQPERNGRRILESTRRRVVNIELSKTVPVRCICVDSESHLFLAGREMIPTHNSEILTNVMAYSMVEAPAPIMCCFPSDVSLTKFNNQKLKPLIEGTPLVKDILTSIASRESSNTNTFKDFAGGQLYLEHAGSPSRLKSTSVKILLVDELDTFSSNLDGTDDPVDMLLGRTSAFPATYKILYASTPQIKGTSRTEELYEKSDQRKFYIACPHCSHEQPLVWRNLKWEKEGKNVRYVCRECEGEIYEHQKTALISKGRWVAENPESKMRGYHLNCLYYPIGLGVRWEKLALTWLECQNNSSRLKTFINDRLAEAFEDPLMKTIKLNIIAERAENYPLRVAPYGVGAITCGVDTQDNRLAVQIVGWGKGMTSWIIDYVELLGDPAQDEVWQQLTKLLNTPIECENGKKLPIIATAIDAGGHRTEAVKDYVRQRLIKRPMVIFGATSTTAPVLSKPKAADVNWRGQMSRAGVHIQHVGTIAIKHKIFSKLSADADKETDSRSLHFSEELSREFFSGFVSETFDPKTNRFINKRGARNEPLDTYVYAFAAAHHHEVRLHLYTKSKWDDLIGEIATKATEPIQNVSHDTPIIEAPRKTVIKKQSSYLR